MAKQNLNTLVTKQDLTAFEQKIREEMKSQFETQKEEIKSLFETYYAKYRDDTLTKLDEAIGRLKASQEEQTIHQGQHEEVTEQVEKLEKLHPDGQHPH